MPFGLKNGGAAYQRLMDVVFSNQIGRNQEVYIDDRIIKTIKWCCHVEGLEDVLVSIRKYCMHLHPTKCSFGVQEEKFIGFMLTQRGIKANTDKCQEIVTIRITTNIKEIQ